jgi:predicted O-methyltransferase YrrM
MNTQELLAKWTPTVNAASDIFTWTEPASLAYCCEVASRSQVMVELGTYMGASAYVMLLANPTLHLWCVDLFEVAGTEKVSRFFLKPFIADGRCELIKGDSAKAGIMLQHMAGKLDAVWVDDGHATPDVQRDIDNFLPLLRSGGELFGHDFDEPANDVALGVMSRLPHWELPVPRVWSYVKP